MGHPSISSDRVSSDRSSDEVSSDEVWISLDGVTSVRTGWFYWLVVLTGARVAAPAWAIERIRPGKMPRMKVAATVRSRARVREAFGRGTSCTGESSAGLE